MTSVNTEAPLKMVEQRGDEGSSSPYSALSSEDNSKAKVTSASSSDDSQRPLKKRRLEGSKAGMTRKRLEEKREYNRKNAARNRRRQKEMVHRLQDRLREATQAMEEARRTNDILKAQVNVLKEQNERLLLPVPPPQPPAAPAVIPPTVFHGAPATQAPQAPPLMLRHHALVPQHTISVLAQLQQSLAAVHNLK